MLLKLFRKLFMSLFILSSFGMTTAHAKEPIKMAVTNWADLLSVANVIKYVMETKVNQPVSFVQVDIGLQYQGVARGDLDLMVCGWLPVSHSTYYGRYKNNLEDLTILYRGGKNGWAVPDYIPETELSSIDDLKKPSVLAKLNGTIFGIEPGGGLMQASERTIKTYGLADYKLQSSSEAGILSAIAKANKNKEWIVATVWSPHWLFQKYKMRYLKDPKKILGGEEFIHAFSSKLFAKKYPDAYRFMKNFSIQISDIEAIEMSAQKDNNYARAAKEFVDTHPAYVKKWMMY